MQEDNPWNAKIFKKTMLCKMCYTHCGVPRCIRPWPAWGNKSQGICVCVDMTRRKGNFGPRQTSSGRKVHHRIAAKNRTNVHNRMHLDAAVPLRRIILKPQLQNAHERYPVEMCHQPVTESVMTGPYGTTLELKEACGRQSQLGMQENLQRT